MNATDLAETSSVTEDHFEQIAENTQNRIFIDLLLMAKQQNHPIVPQTSSVTEDVSVIKCKIPQMQPSVIIPHSQEMIL